jgi:hypothetical protein
VYGLSHFWAPAFPGILLALLPGVLKKESQETWYFKSHILFVNVVALVGTIIASFSAFNTSGAGPGGGIRAVCILT